MQIQKLSIINFRNKYSEKLQNSKQKQDLSTARSSGLNILNAYSLLADQNRAGMNISFGYRHKGSTNGDLMQEMKDIPKVDNKIFDDIPEKDLQILEKMQPAKNEKLIDLFHQMTSKAQSNITTLVDKFKDQGLTLEKYLPAALRQPPLFYQSPETVAKHINIYRFIEKDKLTKSDEQKTEKEIILGTMKKCLSYSDSYLYAHFLKSKMFENAPLPSELKSNSGMKEKLKDYLKDHPEKTYSFSVVNDQMSQEFADFAKEFSKDALDGKNVFDITIAD